MSDIWDFRADAVKSGDKLRDVSPVLNKTRIDKDGYIHYVFSKQLFNNPWYLIPKDNFELFKKFVNGGSRSYPSDGSIPCDIVAGEARIILNEIVAISQDPTSNLYEDAKKALKNGKFQLVRGTLKLYLGKYTTRDWRRKRFTDDIDFWIRNVYLLHSILRHNGWKKNNVTKEWEKKVRWINPDTNKTQERVLIAANDINQLLDFGAGSYLEGSRLKEIFSKKLKRGHDVDLSDIINVAMVNNGINGKHKEEWLDAWNIFKEAANTRSTRITSNLISLIRYALAIADHLQRVSNALKKYNDVIFDKNIFSDEDIERMCKTSIHWVTFLKVNGPDATREMFHEFYHEQIEEKHINAKNLRNFAKEVLTILNSKYEYLKLIFEIEV
ncbi:MAG: hypothetical protein ACTSQJ_13670 [Promethearchaeota archaeon]